MIHLALAAMVLAAAPGPYEWGVLRIIDGDTLQVQPPWLLPGLSLSVRVRGIDAPELAPRARCRREAIAGRRAADAVIVMFLTEPRPKVQFTDIGWGKYGGILVATVTIDGKDLAREMISKGLARPYWGSKKKSWCS